MTLLNKVRWILGIVLVFLLILTTNLVDRQNFTIVRESIETIYADRLVAQNILYDLSNLTWEKEAGQPGVDARMSEAIDRFSATKLTPREEETFSRLQQHLRTLREGEPLTAIRAELNELSDIQLQEGRRQLSASQQAIGLADLFTRLEIGALVILAIAVQVIILYTPKPHADVRTHA